MYYYFLHKQYDLFLFVFEVCEFVFVLFYEHASYTCSETLIHKCIEPSIKNSLKSQIH